MTRPECEALQLERLKRTVAYAYERVPPYRRKLDEAGVTPASVRSLADLRRLPFTTKDDFHDNYPYGLFAVPLDQVVRIHSSSGTIGRPVVVGYTSGDLDTWADLIARLATAAGVTADDVAQIAFGYGMFTGGFGLHYGLERLGATVVPHSAATRTGSCSFMHDFGHDGAGATRPTRSTWVRCSSGAASTARASGCVSGSSGPRRAASRCAGR